MSDLSSLLSGFDTALSGYHVALMVGGVLLGILVGVLPGLGAPNGVALLLPLTFGMEPVSAIIALSSMYWGALFGGSTTAILFNIPGEPSSVATTFDGYPLAQQGRATEALATAFAAAGIGALAGVVVVTLLADSIAAVALRFSSVEYFAVYLLAFCHLHRHGRRRSAEDDGVAPDRAGACRGGHGHDIGRGPAHIRHERTDTRRAVSRRGHRALRHR